MKKRVWLGAVASLALVACGGGESGGGSEAPEIDAGVLTAKALPTSQSFKLSGAEELDVDALFGLMPEDKRPTYDSKSFDSSTGATVLTNFRMLDDSGEGLIASEVELFGVDVDAIQTIITTSETATEIAPDSAVAELFRKVRFHGVSILSDDADAPDFSIKTIEADTLKLKPLPGAGEFSDSQEAAIFFDAFSLGGLFVEGLELNSTSPEGMQVAFGLPDFRLADLAGGKLGGIAVNGLHFAVQQTDESIGALQTSLGQSGAMIFATPIRYFIAPKAQSGEIESMLWTGANFAGLVEAGINGEKPAYTSNTVLDLGQFRSKNAKSYVDGKLAGTNKESRVDAFKFAWLIPNDIKAVETGTNMDLTAYLPESELDLLAIFKENGLDDLQSQSDMTWKWNETAGDAGLDVHMTTKDFLEAKLALDLDGFVMSEIGAAIDAKNEMALASMGKFAGLELTLKDTKAIDTILALAAPQMDVTPEDLRQSAPAMLRMAAAGMGDQIKEIPEYAGAVAAFIEQGGTLTIVAKPAEPVGFMQLAMTGQTNPAALPELLNLTVEHKK